MFNRITDIILKDNLIAIITFQSGEVKEYNFERLFLSCPSYRRLVKETDLFMNGIIAPGGSGVIFDDELDVSCEELYENGVLIRTNMIEDICVQVANIISKLRNDKNITQTELAKLTGIRQSEISKIERAIGNPSIRTLDKIANALDIELLFSFKQK